MCGALGVQKAEAYMVRRCLTVVAVAALLCILLLLASACGESKATAQPSFSPVAQPSLLDIGDVALLKGRPAHGLLHLDSAQGLRILILAEQPLSSYSLRRVAGPDGATAPGEAVQLEGSPHTSGAETAYALLSAQPVAAGYYRLDLAGVGRVISLVVERHE
jgi:hypothetical protein